ncbi:MAG TPA: hypothetical protein VFQ63_00575 [Patescibacteria group bacterium]|nr:hypothetical protein [Patescibacteria group bacterium]
MDWNTLASNLGIKGTCVTSDGAATLNCVPVVFYLIMNAALTLVGGFAAIYMIFAGYKYITAGGDAKQVDSARKEFFYALIGLILVLFSFLLVNIISYLTHITCLTQFGFSCAN